MIYLFDSVAHRQILYHINLTFSRLVKMFAAENEMDVCEI